MSSWARQILEARYHFSCDAVYAQDPGWVVDDPIVVLTLWYENSRLADDIEHLRLRGVLRTYCRPKSMWAARRRMNWAHQLLRRRWSRIQHLHIDGSEPVVERMSTALLRLHFDMRYEEFVKAPAELRYTAWSILADSVWVYLVRAESVEVVESVLVQTQMRYNHARRVMNL